MSITTMEGLTAVPEGNAVIIDRNTWVRRPDGLERNGVTIPLSYFESRLTAGTVEDGSRLPPAQDEWWEGTSRNYYITEVDETTVHYMSFYRPERVSTLAGTSRLATWTSSRTMRRATGQPEGFEVVMPFITLLASSQRQIRQATRDLEHLRAHPPQPTGLAQMRSDLRDARAYMDRLHEYLNRD